MSKKPGCLDLTFTFSANPDTTSLINQNLNALNDGSVLFGTGVDNNTVFVDY